MKPENGIKDSWVLGIPALCMSFVLSQALLTSTVKTDPFQTLLFCLLSVGLFVVLLSYKYTRAALLCLTIFAVAVGAWCVLSGSNGPALGKLLRALGSYIAGKSALKPEHSAILSPAISMSVSLFICIFTVWILNFPAVALTGVCLFVFRQLAGKNLPFEFFGYFLMLCLLYWLLWADKLRAHEEKTAWKPNAKLLLIGIPLCFLCVSAAGLIPVPQTPLRNREAEQESFAYLISRFEQGTQTDNREEIPALPEENQSGSETSEEGGAGEGEPEIPPEPEPPEPEEESADVSPLKATMIAAVAVLFAGAVFGVRLRLRKRKIERMKTLPCEIGVPLVFSWLLLILGCHKFLPCQGETISEFSKRAESAKSFSPATVAESIDAYLPIRYGGQQPDEELRDRMFENCLALIEESRIHLGSARYLFYAALGKI